MSELKKEFKTFMDDVEKNITDPKDLEYIKGRVADFFGVILNEVERIANYKEEKMTLMAQRQQEIEEKMGKMEQIIGNIKKDIYADDEFDFEITCPYCNSEFIVDMDEDKTEITCPECNNVIELDWSGEVDDEGAGCMPGGCASCHGCEPKDKKETDEDDDM